MKIKKVIDFCKQNKSILLYDAPSAQWISDGFSIYPMLNLPIFDEDTICRTYDITDKQQSKITFRRYNGLPSEFDFSDWTDRETCVDRAPIQLIDGGRSIIPYMTSQGVVFMDAKYLLPLSDIEDSMLRVYERQKTNGDIYFALKSGLMLIGIVLPVDVINEQFVTRLKELTQQCEVAMYNKGVTFGNAEKQRHLQETVGEENV